MSDALQTHGPLIYGAFVDAALGVVELGWGDRHSAPDASVDKRLWLHLDRNHPEAKDWLQNNSELPPVVVRSLLQEDTRPKSTRIDDGFLLNLRGANLNEGAKPEDMISLRIWMTDTCLITTSAFRIMAVEDLQAKYVMGDPPLTHAATVTFLAKRLAQRLEPIVEAFEDKVDALEDHMLDAASSPPKIELARFRRSVLNLRRYIAPQREALASFARDGADVLSEEDVNHLAEVHDTVTRLAEDLDAIRERGFFVQEQITEERAEAMNQRLFALAIVSALFLPLGFFTGLFGVNLAGMPGATSPYAFPALCGALLVSSAGLLALFKRLRWF